MAIKDLAVAFNGSGNASKALQFAIQLASQHEAALTGLHAGSPVTFAGEVRRWVGQDVLSALEEAHRQAAADLESRFRSEAAAHNFKGELAWVTQDGLPNEILARLSRYYDLMLMGQYSADPQHQRRVRAEELVLTSGKPLIVVPHGYQVRPFRHYSAVAWDGGSRAARALADAMQILETGKRLDIVTVAQDTEKTGQEADARIMRHLARHGIEGRQIFLPQEKGGIAETILSYCRQNDPDFLVMGAYGHLRLREDLFGGVTRHVLRHMSVPVFMSH